MKLGPDSARTPTGNGLRMSYAEAIREFWETLRIGSSVGSYRYELTAEMLADYRRVVGNPHAAYPTIAARHGQNLFQTHFAADRPGLTNAGVEARYLRPPELGPIVVEGEIAGTYERREKLYVVIETVASDSTGEVCEVTRLIGLLQGQSGVA